MKAQYSTEMLSVLSAVFLVFIFAMFMFSGQIATVAEVRNSMDAQFVASTLGSAINAVYLAGDGANATIQLVGMNFAVWVDGRNLNVRLANSYRDWPLLTNSTVMQNLSFGKVNIRNMGGAVYVENA